MSLALTCSEHNQPIILFCDQLDCQFQKIFLCHKCVTIQLEHLNTHKPLKYYQDLIKFLQQPCAVHNQKNLNDSLKNQKGQKLKQFSQMMNRQKNKIESLKKQLNNLYQESCLNLTQQFQNMIDMEKHIFENNFLKLEKQNFIDKQADALIPTLSEIKRDIFSFNNDYKRIEQYLKQIVLKKQQWLKAAQQIKTLGKRSQIFYRDIILEHFQKKPKFINQERILKRWSNGLRSLIDSIKNQFQYHQNLSNKENDINLRITRNFDLNLLTNNMVRDQTRLFLEYEGQFNGSIVANQLSNLKNLKKFNLSLKKLQLNQKNFVSFTKGLLQIKQLSNFSLICEGIHINANMIIALNKSIENHKNLKILSLSLQFCKINSHILTQISKIIRNHPQLKVFELDLSLNQIKSKEGIIALAHELKGLQNLQNLSLKLGGNFLHHNELLDEGASQIFINIRNFKNIKQLNLDFNHNKLTDDSIIELSITISSLLTLKDLFIDISNNQITYKGGMKLLKSIKKCKCRSAKLNFNNNLLGQQFQKQLIAKLKKFRSIVSLNLDIKNIGLKKVKFEQKQTKELQNIQNCRINY